MGEEDWKRASMIPFLSAGLSISSSSWFESAGLWQARPSFHSLNQICSRSLYHQMKMIVHQAIGMKLPAGLLTRRTQGLEKTFSIQIVPKNLLTPIAPAHQMINSPPGIEFAAGAAPPGFNTNLQPVSLVKTDPILPRSAYKNGV